jgi:SNF2 family DNA or RNA helicase
MTTINTLWNHQSEAIQKAKNYYALHFDPGCGKSRTVIEIFKKEHRDHYGKAIIFAPLNVCRNWENELDLYLGKNNYTIDIVAGQTKLKKLKIINAFAELQATDKHKFLVCNIECLRSIEYISLLSDSLSKFIIVDESHNFKSAKSLQTKGLFTLLNSLRPKYLYLLTGTPTPQGYIDLWSTFALLKKTNDNFFIWRKKHFIDKNERRRGMANYWPEYVISEKSKDYLETLLTECSMSAKKDLVLDLPPLIRTNLYAEMSKEQAKHYDTMKEFLFAIDRDGNELNASNLLVRTLRLQQILAGFIGDTPIKDNARLKVLKDAIDLTQGNQFIIWTIFKPTYKQIASVLDDMGITFGLLTGEQTSEERFNAMQAFQGGKIKALIAHPKAGGVGVNLTAASYSIHYTRSFSLTDDLQAEARNYRGGSEVHKRITRIDIITPKTIDEEIVAALQSKKSVQDFILELKGKTWD